MSDHMKNIIYLPKEDALKPREGHCYVDRWWTVHPEKGLAFYYPVRYKAVNRYSSPQCNTEERIAEHIRKKLYPDHELEFISAVFVGYIPE